MPSWVLAVDYGTTYTTAAIREGNRVELVQVADSPWIPSTVLLDTEGQLLAGHSAEAQAAIYPDRFERTPKRYVGDVPLMLGGYVVPVQDAVAATLHLLAREAIRLQGGPPAELRLTHPARWQGPRLAVLHSAAVRAGLPAPVLIAEPVAAAVHFASRTVRLGERLAVYDFGGGTFDTAVMQRTARGFSVLPDPGGDDQLGGEDLDYALYKRLLAAVEQDDPAAAERLRSSDERLWVATRMQFLAAVRAAKERLSDEQVTRLFVQPPVGRELRLTRDELQQTIHPLVARTVGELDRTIRAAGCGPDELAGIYLAGGSSRIPLVSTLIHQHFGRAPVVLDSPKAVIARGAAVSDGLGRRLDDDEVARGLAMLGLAPAAASVSPAGPPGLMGPQAAPGPQAPLGQHVPQASPAAQHAWEPQATPGPQVPQGSQAPQGSQVPPGQGGGPTYVDPMGPPSGFGQQAGYGQRPTPGQTPQDQLPRGGTQGGRSRRKLLVAGIAAGVLVIGGGVGAAVALTGSGSTPPAPTPGPTSAGVPNLDSFVAALPAGLVSNCKPGTAPSDGAQEVFCQTDTGDAATRALRMSVWIDRFPDTAAMNTYLDGVITDNDVPAARDCNSGRAGAGTWRGVTGDQQRFVCWGQSDGISRLTWASSTGPFAVRVWRHDADIAALAGWYQQVGYRITGGNGPLPTPRGTLNDAENTLVDNLPSDLESLVQSGTCIPWPAGENDTTSPAALVCPGKLAATATQTPTPSPGTTLSPADTATRVVPQRVYIRQYRNSTSLGGALGGLDKVSLPDDGCQQTPSGEGNTTWRYVKNPNKVVGQLRSSTSRRNRGCCGPTPTTPLPPAATPIPGRCLGSSGGGPPTDSSGRAPRTSVGARAPGKRLHERTIAPS